MSHKFNILVIDDQDDTLEIFKLMLSREGFGVILASDAVSGLRAAYRNHPDAVLLDVMMPEVDGFEVCRRLREMTDVPIIFVSAMGTIEDVVRGFKSGADDYVVKPFSRSELIVRLWAALRRSGEHPQESGEILFPTESVMLDCSRHELVVNGSPIYLTPKEFDVIRLLVRHPGKVLSADAILFQVWGPERLGDPDLVKQYIYRLRKKIEQDPDAPRYLHTVWGSGYYFDMDGTGLVN
ncbi:MAG: response regulator transcription factor [Anaerolineae bacterium]|nr:response regulator transcription factor [Anaerolineae bacterium]